jgi:hypothetical protein
LNDFATGATKCEMLKFARRPVMTFPAWLAVVTALALCNPYCCHLLPFFNGFESSAQVQMDAAQEFCPGKPVKTPKLDLLVVPDGSPGVLSILTSGTQPESFSFRRVVERSLPDRNGTLKHLVLGVLRI